MRALLPPLVVIVGLSSPASAFFGLGEPALVRAAKIGNIEKVERLLHNGADPNKSNKTGWTSLMFAANRGHLNVVTALLEAGANPNLESKRLTGNTQAPTPRSTALREALAQGHLAIANLLLDRGAKVDQAAFAIAGGANDIAILQRLLDGGADIDKNNPSPYGYYPSALIVASSKGHVNTVKWLLAKGASLESNPPIKAALKGGNDDLLKLLLDRGADPNQPSGPDATSPLQHAITLHTHGIRHDPDFSLVRLLLQHGADLSYSNARGQYAHKTALEFLQLRRDQAAARYKNKDSHSYLQSREATHVAAMDNLIKVLEAHSAQ